MNRINHKAVILVFLLQLLVGFLWYSAAPTSLLSSGQSAAPLPNPKTVVFFCLAAFVYVYFTAWLLIKVKPPSSFSMMLVIIGVWVCCVLPNFVFISVYLHLTESTCIYLLSFGAVSCLISSIVLPLWRSSRSIFKG